MNRYMALALAIIGGGACAFVVAAVAAVGSAGLLWLFVLGDNPWPPSVEKTLNVGVAILGLAAWAVCTVLIWRRLSRFRWDG